MNSKSIRAAFIGCAVTLVCGHAPAAEIQADTQDIQDIQDIQKVIRLSEPVASTATTETFGAPLAEQTNVLSLQELMSNAERYVDAPVVVQTRIAQVCQKKGCFFIAQEGATSVRVSFKDYSFFVPTNASGKSVTLAGELISREMSAKQAAHFAEDVGAQGAGAPAIKPGRVYEIVASSVRIPKA